MYNPSPGSNVSVGTCPICCSDIHRSTPIIVCPECRTPHHAACWQDHGGCGRHGCMEAARVLARNQGFATKSPHGKNRLSLGDYKDVAGFWMRFFAFFIDNIIIAAFAWGISSVLGTNQYYNDGVTQKWTVPWEVVIPVILVYEVSLTTLFGATIGKMALGLRITNDDGKPVDIGHAILRCIVKFVIGWFCGLPYLVVAFHPDKKGIQDMAANTMVVRMN